MREVAAFEQHPSGETCAGLYDAILNSMGVVSKGILGEYQFKCVLDLLFMTDFIADVHISKWPTQGTGTMHALGRVFPSLEAERHMLALYDLHKQMGAIAGGKLRFPESVMHLCWDERRCAGKLIDIV